MRATTVRLCFMRCSLTVDELVGELRCAGQGRRSSGWLCKWRGRPVSADRGPIQNVLSVGRGPGRQRNDWALTERKGTDGCQVDDGRVTGAGENARGPITSSGRSTVSVFRYHDFDRGVLRQLVRSRSREVD